MASRKAHSVHGLNFTRNREVSDADYSPCRFSISVRYRWKGPRCQGSAPASPVTSHHTQVNHRCYRCSGNVAPPPTPPPPHQQVMRSTGTSSCLHDTVFFSLLHPNTSSGMCRRREGWKGGRFFHSCQHLYNSRCGIWMPVRFLGFIQSSGAVWKSRWPSWAPRP